MQHFSAGDFPTRVLASRLPVLIDFASSVCPPCRMLRPILDKLAHEFATTLAIGTVEVDAEPGAAAAYEVLSMPTLILFNGGKEIARWIGFRSEPDLRWLLSEHGITPPSPPSTSRLRALEQVRDP
jgi:thioredoxin 1